MLSIPIANTEHVSRFLSYSPMHYVFSDICITEELLGKLLHHISIFCGNCGTYKFEFHISAQGAQKMAASALTSLPASLN
jgi:hypothetical protein